jgi:hypothetical protein
VAADEAVYLRPQRNEREKVNKAEYSKKGPAREKMRRLLDVLSPKEARQK